MKGIGVIGAGKMGKIYIQNLIFLGINPEEITIFDAVPEKAQQTAEEFGVKVAISVEEAFHEIVIIASSTPSHVPLIKEASAGGAKFIFCEKPLGMNYKEVKTLQDVKAEVFTAFLVNFSPALEKIVLLMKENNLVIREGWINWGKNRMGDTRPTPGDLEDELVHGINAFMMLGDVQTSVASVDVFATLTYMNYVNKEAQAAAMEIDPSFPPERKVNSSAYGLAMLNLFSLEDQMKITRAPISFQSSYIMAAQRRVINGVLGHVQHGNRYDPPEFSFIINFDGENGDQLTLTRNATKETEVFTFKANRILLELEAFLHYAYNGIMDDRLTNLAEAMRMVKFSDTVRESSVTNSMKTC